AEDGIRDFHVTGVQTCALPISRLALPLQPWPEMLFRRKKPFFVSCSVTSSLPSISKNCPTNGVPPANRQETLPSGSASTTWPTRSEERRVGKELSGRGGSRRHV